MARLIVRDDDPEAPWQEGGVYVVEPGIYRLPLPIPGDHLGAVNVYAAMDGDALVLVDSGVAVAESRSQFEASLDVLGVGLRDVEQFLVTHLHYDHYSQALAVRREFGARVALGYEERHSLRALHERSDPPLTTQFAQLRRYGADDVVNAAIELGTRSSAKGGSPAGSKAGAP
jgi:glyoxylase-like metal-dependent hydrolase (beta-lactamase superfamily II)